MWKGLFVRCRPLLSFLAGAAMVIVLPTECRAWSHQQHILLTRLAALRILEDPGAPEGLKALVSGALRGSAGRPLTLADCERLALMEHVGAEAQNYLAGLDGAATLPDRVQQTPGGREPLPPYGAPESKMHYLDLEHFRAGPEVAYRPDLSGLPRASDIPRDRSDPRLAAAGYLPHRTAETYDKLVSLLRARPRDNARAMETVGYLAHYLQDAHQPHHATIDFRSLSYLVGRVASVREVPTTQPTGGVARGYRADRGIDPHGDLEFQLFENTAEPRKTFRATYWSELTRQLEKPAHGAAPATAPARYDAFERSVAILFDSYRHLPAVGKAAQAGYATGTFDAGAFFSSEWTDDAGAKQTIVHLIAHRNAAAVREVERALRAAWAEAHPTPSPTLEHP